MARLSRPSGLALAVPSVLVLLAASACGSKSTAAPDAGPSSQPGVASGSIGPIDVVAGAEETVCIFKRLDNAEDLMATSFVADLAPGSHHLIVYRSTATEENLDPVSCVPFLGLIDQSAVPIMLAGKRHMEYTLPPNVGMVMPAHQMVKIEAHYINATAAQIEGSGSIVMHGIPLAQAQGYQAADFGFWGTTKIDIPPMASFSTGVKFQAGLPGTSVMWVSSHQHRLGTRVQVWLNAAPPSPPDAGTDDGGSADAGSADAAIVTPASTILDEHDWSNPALKFLDPPLVFDGKNGFDYQCDFTNTTDARVQFGESALNEMCFVGLLYYPSKGFDLCINGQCRLKR